MWRLLVRPPQTRRTKPKTEKVGGTRSSPKGQVRPRFTHRTHRRHVALHMSGTQELHFCFYFFIFLFNLNWIFEKKYFRAFLNIKHFRWIPQNALVVFSAAHPPCGFYVCDFKQMYLSTSEVMWLSACAWFHLSHMRTLHLPFAAQTHSPAVMCCHIRVAFLRGAASLLAGGGAECVLNRGLGLSQRGGASLVWTCCVQEGPVWKHRKSNCPARLSLIFLLVYFLCIIEKQLSWDFALTFMF